MAVHPINGVGIISKAMMEKVMVARAVMLWANEIFHPARPDTDAHRTQR